MRTSTLRAAAGGLVVTRAEVEERVIAPVIGESFRVPVPVARVRRAAGARAARQVKAWVDDVLSEHGRPEWRRPWREAVNAAAEHLERYARLDLSRYRFVLLPRQSHPIVRALILMAEEQGIPTVFLPHSPMTTWQVDLPFSYAGLRGDAERELVVARLAADPARILVVGNPATTVLEDPMPPLRADLPGVLAVSPDPEPVLRHVIELLQQGGLDRVLVAPHPRSDLSVLRRLMPHGWEMHRGNRTLELLRQGAPWMIQMSSGVAWEAAALGIPTADVRWNGREPDYPFLADETVFRSLRNPDDVVRFIATVSEFDREQSRVHARAWSAVDGAEAVTRIRAFLSDIDGPRPRIADGWAPGGALRVASRLRV